MDQVRRSPQGPDCGPGECEVENTLAPTLAQTLASVTDLQTDSIEPTAFAQTSYVLSVDTNTRLAATAVFTETTSNTAYASSPTPTTSVDLADVVPSAQASSKSNNANGVSKGAVVGIAIGTCIVGAAAAFIITFFLFKKRDRKLVQKTCPSGYPIYADSSPELVMVQKSAATGSPYVQVSQTQMRTPVPVPARVPVATPQKAHSDALAGFLPPSASEHDVQNRVASLYGQVHRHVDTYYRNVHASITPSMDSDLASFGKDVDMLELLQNCSSPTVALRHALVAFVLSITGPQTGGEQTLWPDELALVFKAHGSDSAQVATAQALHRRLSIYLYMHNNALAPTTPSQSRLSNLSTLSLSRKTSSAIREAAEHFSLTFFPWADPTFGDQERESDLAGLIGETLECRIWLCGQASEWGFDWEIPGRGAVVVAPGLVVKDDGRAPRRVVLNQSVVGI
ncbi:uncharacterized protein EKO05_0006686 [Ascochyta rabiei]|nr:uncharacterized protein EKO05_0006686 [Ascochyta rabiei]UPX16276.1 hypothetical protein EKO05_0006686 [Ascochyta rabiei]